MEILEINKELQKELNEGFKKIENLCEESINTMEECKSIYDKYVLEQYPILLNNYRKELLYSQELLREIKKKDEKIKDIQDELDRLTRE